MRRREFITLIGNAAGWPLIALAETQPKIPRFGYLGNTTKYGPRYLRAFRQGLQELGHVEGQSIELEYAGSRGISSELAIW